MKEKKCFKTQLDEKNLPFHDALYHFVFSFSALHVKRRLLYIIKGDSGKGF